MGDESKPKTFLVATAKDGRLRFPGLSSSGPWDPRRLTYVTLQAEHNLRTRDILERRWTVLNAEELDHVLVVSHGISACISLLIGEALLDHAHKKWERRTS